MCSPSQQTKYDNEPMKNQKRNSQPAPSAGKGTVTFFVFLMIGRIQQVCRDWLKRNTVSSHKRPPLVNKKGIAYVKNNYIVIALSPNRRQISNANLLKTNEKPSMTMSPWGTCEDS